jgi:hypothetical protein
VLAFAIAACDRHASPAPAPAGSTSAATTEGTSAAGGTSCGALGCAQFDSLADAMKVVLPADGGTLALAIGEAHAPKGATVASAAKRFGEEILPLLKGRASDLLVELMMPPGGCVDAAAEVRQKQAPATSQQAPTNQNEYLAMGERARGLGIVPDMLRPTCADLAGVDGAGDGAIEASLALIARLTTAQAGKLLDRDARSEKDRGKVVVIYGGMIHNDLTPGAAEAGWSYAPALEAKTGGRIVTLNLVVPEFITGEETWRALPWTAHYDRARLGARTTLFRTGEKSFVLVFPAAAR